MTDLALVQDLDAWKDRNMNIFGHIEALKKQKDFFRSVGKSVTEIEDIEKLIKEGRITEDVEEFKKLATNMAKANKDFIKTMAADFKVFIHLLHMELVFRKVIQKAEIDHKMPEKIANEEIQELNKELKTSLNELETVRQMAIKVERSP